VYQDVDNLTALINCSPQVMIGSVESDKDFVNVPSRPTRRFVLPQLSGVFGSELATP
jgi:hypothetical protein